LGNFDIVVVQVLFGITDDELNVLDEFEDVEYERENVQVLLTVSHSQIHSPSISIERKKCVVVFAKIQRCKNKNNSFVLYI